MRFTASLCVAAVFIALAGCSSHKTYIPTASGGVNLETNKQNNTTTLTSKEGSMTVGQNAVDLAKLGLPVYPGASAKNGGLSMQTKEGATQTVVLTTPDAFPKVYDWYKGKMPADSAKMHIESQAGGMATFEVGSTTSKEHKSVMITVEQGATNIILSTVAKTQ